MDRLTLSLPNQFHKPLYIVEVLPGTLAKECMSPGMEANHLN